jgi:TolA-binding protein
MKQIVIILVCVALIAPVVFADKIVCTKRLSYSGKLDDCKDYTVAIKLSSRKTIRKNLTEIAQIVSTSNDALTKAEEAVKKKQFDEALTLYDQALKNARTPWMGRLIEIRRFQALGKTGKINGAIAEWIKRCDESPAAVGFAPTGFAPKASKANDQAVTTLENKIKVLEKDLAKNKVYIMGLLNLKMKIQEANGNPDAVILTAEQLDAVTSDQPRPTVISSTKAPEKTPSESPAPEPSVNPEKKSASEVAIVTDEPASAPKAADGWKNLDVLENLLKTGKADTVIERIQTGLKKYDNKQLPEAMLLLGKAQMQKFEADDGTDKKLLVAAGLNFMRVYVGFDKAPQASEGLYLAGVVNGMIGDKNSGKLAMRQLISEYAQADPENEFVVKAREKLTELDKTK